MRVVDVKQNSDEWLELRKGRITGSKLADVYVKRGNSHKVGFYQLIADRLALDGDDEDVMERGHRLEEEAIAHFEAASGKTVKRDAGMWLSDDDEAIAVSPDGVIEHDGKAVEAVEVKCLKSARHIEAILTDKVPSEYELQVIQYFVVNPDLEVLYVVFYDPRLAACPLHVIEVWRDDLEGEIEAARQYQLRILREVEAAVERLAF